MKISSKGGFNEHLRALADTVAVARLIFPAYQRPALVDPAQHGASVQRRAPAVIETRHDPAAPAVLLRQFGRNVIAAHQHHLQPATAGFTGGAGDGRGLVHVVFRVHASVFSHAWQQGQRVICAPLYDLHCHEYVYWIVCPAGNPHARPISVIRADAELKFYGGCGRRDHAEVNVP